ncbi:hypothetical protein C8J57DRAFT_1400037 [Mycena rebaudengoi]|nr:hypothetical protein C8J57DRAFT_1400037 [Mycena rebaudengoi]
MPGPTADHLFGPMLIGVLLSTTLYGVVVVQMSLYFQAFKKDASYIRYLIIYLLVAETVVVAGQIGIIYEPLIIRYGAPESVIFSPKLLPADAISIVLVSTPIQLFTAWRISVITGSKLSSLFVSALALASFTAGLLVSVSVSMKNEFRKFQSFQGVVIIWLSCSAACDVLITIVLTYSLRARKTGMAVDSQVNRIIRLTVQTGAVTAIAALLDFILFLAFPGSSLNFIPDFSIPHFFTISLLSTLNARIRGRSKELDKRMPNALFHESHSVTPTSTLHSHSFSRSYANTVRMQYFYLLIDIYLHLPGVHRDS